MKKFFVTLVLFCVIGIGSSIAQSVRIDFIRFKKIEYNNYLKKWNSWPVAWNESGAYAIIKLIYDETYKVSVYSHDGTFLVSSTCTFDSGVTSQKRKSQNLPYLNCYTDTEDDQVWTNVVSLESLLKNVKEWEQDGAQLYLWVFGGSTPFAFVFE